MFLSAFLFGGGRRADGLGDRSVFGDFWFSPVGMLTGSGRRVTSDAAMRLSAVFSCVKVRSESFAVLPFRMYRKRSDRGRDEILDHWLVRLMQRPNRWQTGFEWSEMMQAHLDLRGNGFNYIVNDGRGGIAELQPIHPDRVKAEAINTPDGFRYVVNMPDGTQRRYARSQIWHIKGLSQDGVCGLNPIEVAAEAMGVGLAGQSYASRFFANDARPGGWIELDGKFPDEKAKETFRESWQRAQGGRNRGKTAVLEKGFKYHELTVNNSDAQFLEVMKQNRSEIAGMFRVPPHKIGDLERATFTNIEQQSMDFVQDCMQPLSQRWESSIRVNLLPDAEAESIEIEYDFSVLLRGDMQARSSFYTGMINNGSMTRNQARVEEGWNPLPGLDEPLVPVNMQPASAPPPQPGKQPAQPPQPAPAPSPKPRKKAEADERMQHLARGAADRLARREAAAIVAAVASDNWPDRVAEAMNKHAAVIEQALGVTPEAVAAYIEARKADPIRAGHEEEDIYSAALAKLEILALEGTL